LVKYETKLYELNQIIDRLSRREQVQESAMRLNTVMIKCGQAKLRRIFKKNEKAYCSAFGVMTYEEYEGFIRTYHENLKDVDRFIASRIDLLEEAKAKYYGKIAKMDISPF
jgi:hypothetical protein